MKRCACTIHCDKTIDICKIIDFKAFIGNVEPISYVIIFMNDVKLFLLNYVLLKLSFN